MPPWFETYVGLEAEATRSARIRSTSSRACCRPWATPALARATQFAADVPSVEQRVEPRVRRAARLSGDPPLHVWAIVGEGALWRQVGGPAVFAEQREHLAKLAEQPNITVQVMSFEAGAHPATGAFVIARFPEPQAPDVVYLESPVGLGARPVQRCPSSSLRAQSAAGSAPDPGS